MDVMVAAAVVAAKAVVAAAKNESFKADPPYHVGGNLPRHSRSRWG